MRKIEQKLCAAIKNRKSFQLSNTTYTVGESSTDMVTLFGNRICYINWELNQLEITNCGYETITTKSRLNAILSCFDAGFIYQKNHQWYYCDNDLQEHEFPCNRFMTIDMQNSLVKSA